MKKEERGKVNDKERVIREIDHCLENHKLFFLTDKQRQLKIPYVDHMGVDILGNITQHPYHMSMTDMKKVIEECEKEGFDFMIHGHSCYYPNSTFCIEFYKKGDDKKECKTHYLEFSDFDASIKKKEGG